MTSALYMGNLRCIKQEIFIKKSFRCQRNVNIIGFMSPATVKISFERFQSFVLIVISVLIDLQAEADLFNITRDTKN